MKMPGLEDFASNRVQRNQDRLRSGFTLVELLVVLAVFTFMLTSVALAIGTLLRAKDVMQEELTTSTTVSRLAAHWRADAHQASAVERMKQPSGEEGVRMHLVDRRIEYTHEANRLIRRLYRNGEERHREVFSLPEGSTLIWELTEEAVPLVSLTISFRSEIQPDSAPRVHRIEAVAGFHTGAAE